MKQIMLISAILFLFNVGFVVAGYLENGKRYIEQGKYEEAEKEFTKYIEKNSSDPEGFTNRALCRIKLNHQFGAIKDYDKACELGSKEACSKIEDTNWIMDVIPDTILVGYNIGIMLKDEKKFNEAIIKFEEVLSNVDYFQKLLKRKKIYYKFTLDKGLDTEEVITLEEFKGKIYWRLVYVYNNLAFNLYSNDEMKCKEVCQKGLDCVNKAKNSYPSKATLHSAAVSELWALLGVVYCNPPQNCQEAKKCMASALSENSTNETTIYLINKIKQNCK